MNLLRRWRKWVRGRHSPDDEIRLVRAALLRHRAAVDRMSGEWEDAGGGCCPGCMFGAQYTKATDQFKRTGAWLCVLLKRRGSLKDIRLAGSIEMGAWP